jgi:hypothetical protein
MAVKATFPLARRICAAQDGSNYLYGIPGDEARLAPTMPLSEEEPMADRADPTGGALELATSAAPPRRGGGPPWPPSPDPPARWLGCCWWKSWAARGRTRLGHGCYAAARVPPKCRDVRFMSIGCRVAAAVG